MSINPKKRFGQNFLRDKNWIKKIITSLVIHSNDHVVEIGPGLGALTKELLPLAAKLEVIEIDRDLITHLQNLGKIHVYHQDVLQFNFATLFNANKLRIVGNLPYNISTPMLFHLLRFNSLIQDLHFMLQREVAERIVAKSGTKTYGRLSIMIQYYYEPEILFTIGPEAFYPKPKVTSSFIRLLPKTRTLVAKDTAKFAQLVNLAFSKRRKMIKNSLFPMITPEILQSLNLSLTIRPEDLTVDDFVRISNQ